MKCSECSCPIDKGEVCIVCWAKLYGCEYGVEDCDPSKSPCGGCKEQYQLAAILEFQQRPFWD